MVLRGRFMLRVHFHRRESWRYPFDSGCLCTRVWPCYGLMKRKPLHACYEYRPQMAHSSIPELGHSWLSYLSSIVQVITPYIWHFIVCTRCHTLLLTYCYRSYPPVSHLLHCCNCHSLMLSLCLPFSLLFVCCFSFLFCYPLAPPSVPLYCSHSLWFVIILRILFIVVYILLLLTLILLSIFVVLSVCLLLFFFFLLLVAVLVLLLYSPPPFPSPPPHFYHSVHIPCYPSGYPCSCFGTAAIAPRYSHASNLSSSCFFSFTFSRCPFWSRSPPPPVLLFRQRSNKWCRHRQRPAVPAVAYGIQTLGCCNVAWLARLSSLPWSVTDICKLKPSFEWIVCWNVPSPRYHQDR